ncbi:MAG: hypothetical protein QF732_07580, partial [Nitrospinaceae bacterium]|nr:hypothetical protein [Nitrospinaceae bacterium]
DSGSGGGQAVSDGDLFQQLVWTAAKHMDSLSIEEDDQPSDDTESTHQEAHPHSPLRPPPKPKPPFLDLDFAAPEYDLRGVWAYKDLQSRFVRAYQRVHISDEQSKNQYKKVGNDPSSSWDLRESDLSHVLPVSPSTIEMLEADYTLEDLKTALAAMKDGARDREKLVMSLFSMYDLENKEMLLKFYNRSVGKGLAEWDSRVFECGVHALWKGRGAKTDPSCYRFITIVSCFVKLACKLANVKLAKLMTAEGLLAGESYGFWKNVSTADAQIIYNRISEDLGFYDFPIAALDNLKLPLSSAVDQKKAFPSLDWRTVTAVIKRLGIEHTCFWRSLEKCHRASTFHFGTNGLSCSAAHGLKEGCCTSPTLYLMVYSAIVTRFRINREKINPKTNANNLGPQLLFQPDVIEIDRRKHILNLSTSDSAESYRVSDVKFADDTTLFESIPRSALSAYVRDPAVPGPLNEPPALKIYGDINSRAGARENMSKREIDVHNRAQIRLLGIQTQGDEDTKVKVQKAVSKFHASKSILAGGRWTRMVKMKLMVSMIRNTLEFGLDARGVTQGQFSALSAAEHQHVSNLLNLPNWKMQLQHVHYSDIYRDGRTTDLEISALYKKGRTFGHIMRRDDNDTVKRILCGKMVPDFEHEDEKHLWLFDPSDVGHRVKSHASIVGDVAEWLTVYCGIPFRALPFIVGKKFLSPHIPPAVKNPQYLYYDLTREAYLRCTKIYWSGMDWRKWGRCLKLRVNRKIRDEKELSQQAKGEGEIGALGVKRGPYAAGGSGEIGVSERESGDDGEWAGNGKQESASQEGGRSRGGRSRSVDLDREEAVAEANAHLSLRDSSFGAVDDVIKCWCKKFGIRNEKLNTHHTVFRENYCFICDADFQGSPDLASDEKLNRHIESEHLNLIISEEQRLRQQKLVEEYQRSIESAQSARREEFEETHAEEFTTLGEGHYRCNYCDLTFATSYEALEKHLHDHTSNNYMKIAKIKSNRKDAGLWVPEYHSSKDGRFQAGSIGKYEKFIFPVDCVRNADDKYFCRKCHKFGLDFGAGVTSQAKCHRVNILREHEAKCKGKAGVSGTKKFKRKKQKIKNSE